MKLWPEKERIISVAFDTAEFIAYQVSIYTIFFLFTAGSIYFLNIKPQEKIYAKGTGDFSECHFDQIVSASTSLIGDRFVTVRARKGPLTILVDDHGGRVPVTIFRVRGHDKADIQLLGKSEPGNRFHGGHE